MHPYTQTHKTPHPMANTLQYIKIRLVLRRSSTQQIVHCAKYLLTIFSKIDPRVKRLPQSHFALGVRTKRAISFSENSISTYYLLNQMRLHTLLYFATRSTTVRVLYSFRF